MFRYIKRFLFQPGVCYFGGFDTGLSNSGWLGATTISSVASTVNAGIYAWASQYAAQKQDDVARKYWVLAREMHDYWNQHYKPCEISFALEVGHEPKYIPRYEWMAASFNTNLRRQFHLTYEQAARIFPRYSININAPMVQDISIAQSMYVGDSMNYAYRYEEARKEAKDDVRFSRRVTMVGLGRNMLQQALQFSQAAAGLFGNVGDQLQQGLRDAMGALGYGSARTGGSEGAKAMRGASSGVGDSTASKGESSAFPYAGSAETQFNRMLQSGSSDFNSTYGNATMANTYGGAGMYSVANSAPSDVGQSGGANGGNAITGFVSVSANKV